MSLRRFMLFYVAILVLGIATAHFCVQTEQVDYPYGHIDVVEAKKLVDQSRDVKIVDIRLEAEYRESHIVGAINVCACDPDSMLVTLHTEDRMLIYCRNGLKSSATLIFLNEHGFNKVYNLIDGLNAWKEAGYPTEET